MRTDQLLKEAARRLTVAGMEEPQFEAAVLLAHLLGMDRIRLHLHPAAEVESSAVEAFRDLIERRAGGEPTAYLTGEREFWSRSFAVTRHTLIPRPETELIVETAMAIAARERWRSPRILDLGTGSGVIAVSLAREMPEARITATDRSFSALCVARANAQRHAVAPRVHFVLADWISAFSPRWGVRPGREASPAPPAKRCFDLVVSNPPYVARTDMDGPSEKGLLHEPREALLGGEDGLKHVRLLVSHVPEVLRSKGWFLCEIGWDQGERVLRHASETRAYRELDVIQDLAGRDRVLKARAK